MLSEHIDASCGKSRCQVVCLDCLLREPIFTHVIDKPQVTFLERFSKQSRVYMKQKNTRMCAWSTFLSEPTLTSHFEQEQVALPERSLDGVDIPGHMTLAHVDAVRQNCYPKGIVPAKGVFLEYLSCKFARSRRHGKE